MSSSALYNSVLQGKISNIQNAADSSGVYSSGVWSFKNSTALTSVTITDAGNVGIGTASPANRLHVYQNAASNINCRIENASTNAGNLIQFSQVTNGSVAAPLAYIGHGGDNTGNLVMLNMSNTATVFSTNATERMRIDASGNLFVGTTSGGRKVNIEHTDSSGIGVTLVKNPSTASSGVAGLATSLGSGNGSQNNTNCWHFRGTTENVGIWYLYGNGTSSFTSDQRLKKNIESARGGYLEDLCKLRVVKYHWNTSEDSEAKELGLIAQEVEQVFPGLVQEADVEFEGGLKPKVLKGSVLPFMLLKAIQEQQAMIESMKAEIEALKAK